MSVEGEANSSSVADAKISGAAAEPAVPDQVENEDDSDFVLVSRKKHSDSHHQQHNYYHQNSKHHARQNHYHHRGGQSSYYNDSGGSYQNSENDYSMTEGRRKKFRDRDNRDRDRRDNSGSRPFRSNPHRINKPRDHHHNHHQSNAAHSNQSSQALPSNSSSNKENNADRTNQIEKTAPPTNPASSVAVKTFSLVVATGASSPPIISSSSSGCSQAGVESNNEQTGTTPLVNGHVSNRPLLLSVGNEELGSIGGSGGSGCTGSSSVADTASVSSENETIDSLTGGAGTTKSSLTTEGSSSLATPVVEYVDAPLPKVNPWLVHGNAAQLINGSSSKKVSLVGFPSVNETAFPDTLSKSQKSPSPIQSSSSSQPQQKGSSMPPPAPPKQTGSAPRGEGARPHASTSSQSSSHGNTGKPTGSASSSVATNSSKPSPQPPASFAAAAVSSRASTLVSTLPQQQCKEPASFSSKTAVTQSTQPVDTVVQPASSSNPQPYYREMANGFRPGRGRGSYSASASGRKISNRNEVLMKVAEQETHQPKTATASASTEDWPTLGEAIAKITPTAAHVSSEALQSKNDKVEESSTLEKGRLENVDVVDSHFVPQPRGQPPAAKEVVPVPTVESKTDLDQGGSSSHDSDNDYARGDSPNASNGNGSNRKPSKQKWVPLDITAEERGRAMKAGPVNKKYGYYSGYPRARGKENVMNGHLDYAESERLASRHHGYGGRGMRGGRGGSGRGGGPRRHNINTMTGGNNHHRTNTNMTMTGHALNGHVDYNILSPSAQAPPGTAGEGYTDYPADFTTLTPMYPAVSEFIMPYVANGYFPTPFTPPAGVVVDAAGDPHQISAAAPSPTIAVAVVPANAAAVPSASAYVPVNDLTMLIELVRQQIEYYFSEGNLEKDFYLRRKMDEHGFLPVHLIATFPRVKNMTQEYSVVLSAIQSSDNLELKPDMTSVRTRKDPRKWPIQDSGSNPLPNSHSSTTSTTPSTPTTPTQSSAPFRSSAFAPESTPAMKTDPILSQQNSINNNNYNHTTSNRQHDQHVVEQLNPNVPEFVPKSNVAALY